MFPELFRIGPVPINSYGTMIAIGFLISLYFIRRAARREGIDPDLVSDAAFYILPVGLLGARLLHIAMFPSTYSWSDPIGWIAIWRGGLVFQGGPPAAMAFLWYYARRRGIAFWTIFDLAFPYLPLAHAFGRMGCFLKGCCYGKPTNVPWAIPARRVPWDLSQPPDGSPAYLDHLQRFSDMTPEAHWSHPIHPTQLYELVGLLIVFGIMLALRKYWRPFPGFTLPVYLVLYGVLRFFVEMFRGDHNPVHVLGLSDQQAICVGLVLLGVAVYFPLRARTALPGN